MYADMLPEHHAERMLMLKIHALNVTIQSAQVLRDFSMNIPPGSMVGLIGRNGAGKTTLVRTIMGHLIPSSGTICFENRDLIRIKRHERAPLGIGYMPEDRGLVPELTVEENLLVPVWVSRTLDIASRLAFVYGILPEIQEMRNRRALLLSGGQQKLAALGRALAVGTHLLILDEPFEGVAPALSRRLSEVIAGLRGSQISVLIAQSDLNRSRDFLDTEIVIERGANVVSRMNG